MFISPSVFWQSLLISSLVLIIPIAFSSIEDSYLAHNCLSSSRGEFTPGSAYQQSLLYLVDNLCANAPKKAGFWNASWAEVPSERAYGLALCRGDVSPEDCKTCLTKATITVAKTYCPHSRGAIIWRDYCMLKYSDLDFLGKMNSITGYIAIMGNVSDSNFREAALGLMGNLSQTAIGAPHKFFANGTTALENRATLYSMVQCTRDISADYCRGCLAIARAEISIRSMNNDSGQVVSASCNVRYDRLPFLN
ncbi:cysteine-rich repeat secretory protein 38 [Phtheirospermum japonicum]|uniref:Cysteine-rich repeat secretory protein 38 n=1 Tax=Phtheirospermum japonicum TaxID=374723 RepID=A0A830BVB9_9LAMI|nr:cysteine-rich repeat secretory protein 38 [Phtheirospermum japonicum]